MSRADGLTGVIAESADEIDRAQALAQRLGTVFLDASPVRGWVLAYTPQHLELRNTNAPRARPLCVDFTQASVAARMRDGRRAPLPRALGLHRRPGQFVLDATCGLGGDAAILLGLGSPVFGCERSLIIAALLEDGIARAPQALRDNWRGLAAQDTAEWLQANPQITPEVIYMDPMFDTEGRRALPKQSMQWLHSIVGKDNDAGHLLESARARAQRRVVVKRHPRNPPLAPPDRALTGRKMRFDIYLN